MISPGKLALEQAQTPGQTSLPKSTDVHGWVSGLQRYTSTQTNQPTNQPTNTNKNKKLKFVNVHVYRYTVALYPDKVTAQRDKCGSLYMRTECYTFFKIVSVSFFLLI